jgi:hypothetical protein
MSQVKESLPHCPALVCPGDLRLLGYPFAELPNGTASTAAIHGFTPVRLTQFPPPGTPLWRNTTTDVTISAVDSDNRTLECTWSVSVAPLVQLGTVNLTLPSRPNGTFLRTGRFRGSPDVRSGIIYKMSGALQDRLQGRGSRVSAALRRGSNKQSGDLPLEEGEVKGRIGVPSVQIKYSTYSKSDVQVSVTGSRTDRRNHISYKVFGQVEAFRV